MPRVRTGGDAPVTTSRDRVRIQTHASIGLAMAALVLAAVYFLVPLLWLIVSATKNNSDLFGTFGLWFGGRWSLGDNLSQLFTYQDGIYLQWLRNTFIYAGGSGLVGTLISSAAGYALAKYDFRGRDLIFSLILGAILVPVTALALPLYLLLSAVHLTNTYWSIILPGAVSPFGVYLSRIYAAASIPDDLIDAARVDGANDYRIFVTLALRVMQPALVTIFLFQFVAVWNNYFLPLVMLSNQNLYPITLGLQTWNLTTVNSQLLYSLIVTGSLVSVVPLIIGFLILQRYWRTGLTAGAVHG